MKQAQPDVDSIFCIAIEIDSPDMRRTYLDQACAGDAGLKARVEKLLGAHQRVGSFLEESPASLMPTMLTNAPPEPLGAMIGPYKLREVLGEGGMGIVYVAEQERPIRRKVALKIIKPGMDTREVIGRFEAERQALALMDHANIAKVHDAGTTETGRPYFVMELVRGMPITEYCDRRKLPPRERIKLFITVCQAIQHAHQRGIIHRDLKPSNVLITLHDGTAVPKVIDFGVAKAVNQKLTEHTLYTRHAQLIGTPLYMSPEQAELSGLEIDTRSDVYSLGVLLYELLTGHTLFDKETFSKIGYDEMRRMIREDEPARPSHRVSTLAAEARSTVSSQRATDERRLAHDLRGELDWIVMKALEKDRTRRYGGADALAADLQSYLDDQPIQACPPSVGYRVRKLVRRKTRAVGTTTVLMVTLALAVGGPLAAYGVFVLIRGTDSTSREAGASHAAQQLADASTASHLARALGRELPGLVPEPLFIPEVGRWQLITKRPRGVLRSAVWSPDEKWMALAEANHVRIYDASTPQLLHVLVGHNQPVTSVAWHPDGKRLASASEDGTVRLWTGDGVPTHVLKGHSGPVYKVAWRPDGTQVASAAADGSVRIWSAVDGEPVRVLDEGGRHVFGIDWSPDGSLLASVGGDIRPAGPDGNPGDNSIRVWDADSGALVQKIDGTVQHSALCVDWRPDGKQLAVGYGDMYRSTQVISGGRSPIRGAGVRLWNIDGTLGHELISETGSGSTGEFGTINVVAWEPPGKRLAFGGRHGLVWLWNADDQSLTDTQAGNLRDVGSISWKRDGSGLLTSSRESIREWDARDGRALVLLAGLSEGTQYLLVTKWSPDGTTVSARLSGGTHLFWNADGKPVNEPDRPNKNVPGWWEVASQTRRPDGAEAPKLEGPFPAMREWAWSKHGWLAGASWADASVRIWNDQGKLIATLKDHRGGVESVDWSPDGEMLASGGGDSVRLWKPDGTPGPVLTGHTDEVYPVAWSPDGQWIASGGTDSTVRLWKPDGTPGPVFRGHQGGIHDLAWSADSKRIASASWLDNTLRVWNVETGKTEWQVLKLGTDADTIVTLSGSGQPLHGERELMESGLLYLVEKPNGTMDLLMFSDFRKRYAKSFMTVYGDRNTKAVAKGDKAIAETALADEATFISDANLSATQSIALARRLRDCGRFEAALGVLATAQERHPDDVSSLRFSPGEVNECSDEAFRAGILSLADRMVERLGNNSLAWFARGNILSGIGKHDRALVDYAKSIELEPNFDGVYLNRANTWNALKEYDKAVADFSKVIELSPGSAMAYNNRGNTWYHLKQSDKALADYTKAIELKPTDSIPYENRAQEWHIRGQYDKEVADYAKAIELRPQNAALWSHRALAWTDLKEYDKALADFSKAVELAPNSPDLCNTLAWFLVTCPDARLRDDARAVELARKAVSLAPGTPNCWGTLGTAEYRNGNWADALAASRKAVEMRTDGNRFDRGWAVNSIFLAMAHWQLGHKDEAVSWYDKVVEWMEQNKSDDEELKRFHTEAAALLGVPEGTRRRPTDEAQPTGPTEARPAAVPLPEE